MSDFKGVSIRTDPELELRLDRLALALSRPGERATRAFAARAALVAGLLALEEQGLAAERPEGLPAPGKRRRALRSDGRA
jgi:predicted transcriptional regulator